MKKPKSPLVATLDKLRTIAWAHGLRVSVQECEGVSDEMNFGQLAAMLARKHRHYFQWLPDSKQLNKYALGKPTPNEAKLKLFEEKFPGTSGVFEKGPDGSLLWRAISCRDIDTARNMLAEIDYEFRVGVPVDRDVILGVVTRIVPTSLAERLKLQKRKPAERSRLFRKYAVGHPSVVESLGTLGAGQVGHYLEGPLLTYDNWIAFAPGARDKTGIWVMPPALTAFAIQILAARIQLLQTPTLADGVVVLYRQLEIERRLKCFGLSLDQMEKATGFKIARPVMIEVPARQTEENFEDGSRTVRLDLAPHTVPISTDGNADIAGPIRKELRLWNRPKGGEK